MEEFVEGGHFAVVEVVGADDGENGERVLSRGLETRAGEDYSSGAGAVLGEFGGEAGAAGKSGQIDAVNVDGQARVVSSDTPGGFAPPWLEQLRELLEPATM